MTGPGPTYRRAPSEELRGLLSRGGFLFPIVQLARVMVGGHYHDVHFRPNDEVDVYRGRTSLVRIKNSGNGRVDLRAHSTYKNQPCGQSFLHSWHVDEMGFGEELDRYLNDLKVNPSFTRGEGRVQEQWSLVRDPWVPFDREGELKGPHDKGADFPQVQTALTQLAVLAQGKRWKSPNATGIKIDQLAVDEKGQLVLLELKDGSKSSAEVYYSPYQLLQYVWEWHTALEALWNDLQELINARNQLEMSPHKIPDLTGGIRAAVGFGFDTPRSDTKLNYAKVLEVVNRHLPDGIKSIETWAFTDTDPTRLEI